MSMFGDIASEITARRIREVVEEQLRELETKEKVSKRDALKALRAIKKKCLEEASGG